MAGGGNRGGNDNRAKPSQGDVGNFLGVDSGRGGAGGRNDGPGGRNDKDRNDRPGGRNDGLGDLNDGLGDRNDGLGDRNDGLGDRNDGLGGRNDGLGGRNDGLGDRNDGLGDRNDGLGDRNDGLGGRNDGLGGRNDGLGGRNDGLGGRNNAGNRNNNFDRAGIAAGGFAAGAGFGEALNNRPENRGNWEERSQNRNDNWQNRVDSRNDAWSDRSKNREQARDDWGKNQEKRWNELENRQDDRQNWRDQSREDWQKQREDVWDYRGDRAEEIWDNTADFYDDVFDDRWWGSCGWYGHSGHYPANPWWWWAPATWAGITTFVALADSEPVYVDYGLNVIYEGDTVYVDNQPVPAAEYKKATTSLATNAELPPPPGPAEEGKEQEWMPLGVFALAQEEKGDPVMFFQFSVNREGLISGGYTSTLTKDQRPIAGQIDKKTQAAAWRIGENHDTIFTSTLANLTQDVSPVALNFKDGRTQTWLLVRLPEPPPAGKPASIQPVNHTPPPLKTAGVAKKPSAANP